MPRIKARYSFDSEGNFVIDNYNYASVFASFLPAIAGKKGIPLWAFYINRAQLFLSPESNYFRSDASGNGL